MPASQRKAEIKNIYLKDFPEAWDQEKIKSFLEEEMQKHGKVISSGVYKNTAKNKFYSFVAFESVEGAKKAMEALNGMQVEQ